MVNIDSAIILAAGQGKRMMPLTRNLPKPMITVHGRPLIDHIITHLRHTGVTNIVVNTHYHSDILHAHLANEPDITISHEPDILETGGGIVNALPLLGDTPFFITSGDAYWQETHILDDLQTAWCDDMDLLLCLQPKETMGVGTFVGDYNVNGDGRPALSQDRTGTHMFTSIRIAHPRCLAGKKTEYFSFLEIMKECEAKKTLYAMEMNGHWHHLSTPHDVEALHNA